MPKKREMFYKDLANKNLSHLSYTKIGNNYAAIHLGFKTNNNFVYLLPAYDSSFNKYSPGWIHIDYLLNECVNLRIKKFDLTIGNEGYKKRISTNNIKIYTFIGSDIYSLINLFIVRFYYYFKNFSFLLPLKNFKKILIRN